ncbi:MAG: SRPBCC family protein [Ilumatobacteraceae bacterium]
MITFERRTLLPVDLATAFDLSLDIDAHLGSMAESGERAVGGVTGGIIGLGEFVTWRARHFGVTWTMTSEITCWDRPDRFIDEQTKGPFKTFWHQHEFRTVEGGTELHDTVRFEAPLGVLGRIAERAVLRRYMPHLIDVRNQFLVVEAARH